MPTTFTVPDGYGNVALVSLGAIPVLAWLQGVFVTSCRLPAGVPYPHAYATVEQVKANPMAYKFNCAQRAHGQLLENMPQTMLAMLLAGLEYPRATAYLGLAWMAMRIVYWAGYVYSSRPGGNGRLLGAAFWGVQGVLWGLGISTALKMA